MSKNSPCAILARMGKAFIFLPLLLIPSFLFGQSGTQNVNGLQLQGAFTAARAMTAIYGSYDYLEGSKWTPQRTKSYPQFWPDSINVKILLDVSYTEAAMQKHLIVTAGVPNTSDPNFSCHSCGVLISLVLFTRNRQGWRVESSDLQFGQYGQFGNPPSISLQPLGPSRFGLQIPESFGAQGAVSDSVTLVLPKEGRFLKVFAATIAASWSEQFCSGAIAPPAEADNCAAYDGAIETLVAPKSEYYDLVLTKRVYRTISGKIPEGTTTVTYRFNGTKYVPR